MFTHRETDPNASPITYHLSPILSVNKVRGFVDNGLPVCRTIEVTTLKVTDGRGLQTVWLLCIYLSVAYIGGGGIGPRNHRIGP